MGSYVAFFDDMLVALEAYPETYVTLEIIDVVIEEEDGDVFNEGDEAAFKVKLTNSGPLNLTGVTVRIDGVHGATVKKEGAAAQFEDEFVYDLTPRPTINGDGGELIVPINQSFHFKAPAEPQDEKTLVKATLERWDGDLSRIMINHSEPHREVPKGTYSAAVVES
jgi:hypothetical protein